MWQQIVLPIWHLPRGWPWWLMWRCSAVSGVLRWGVQRPLTVSVLVGSSCIDRFVVHALPSLRSAGLPATLLSTLDKSQELVNQRPDYSSPVRNPWAIKSGSGTDRISVWLKSYGGCAAVWLVSAALQPLVSWAGVNCSGDLRTVRWGSTDAAEDGNNCGRITCS